MGSRRNIASTAGRSRSWRKAAALAGASVVLSAGTLLATAGGATAAVVCPPGTVQFFNACLTIGIGTPPTTTPPVTTPPTTSPPLTLPPITLPPVTLPPAPANPVNVPEAAQRLLDLANNERQQAGLGQLTMRSDIVQYALDHSNAMAAKGDIFHSTLFFTASVKNLLNAAFRGENVAYNGSIEDAHNRLMNSAGHRANILDGRFNAAGFAVVRAPDGRYFITEDFIQAAGAPRAAAAPPKAAAPVAKAATPKPAPAPTTTVAPTTTTAPPPPPPVAAPAPAPEVPVTTAPPVAERTSSAVSGTPVKHDGEISAPLGGAAAVLLAGLVGACCVVPRRKLLT